MTSKRPLAVLTGFKPFPGVAENPAQTVVEAVSRRSADSYNVICHLIETRYDHASAAMDCLVETSPDVIVMLGYSHLAEGFAIEARATNICAPDKPDASGFVPAKQVENLSIENKTMDCAGLAQSLVNAGYSARISHDAGSYVCNHIYFRALDRCAAAECRTSVIFVHIPAISSTTLAETSAASMPLDELTGGVMHILDAMACETRHD